MSDQKEKHDELQDVMSVADFTGDAVAVQETRQFMATTTGKKLKAMLKGLHPLRALVTSDANSPAVIREAARQESESCHTLLGKITGFEVALKAITETAITVRSKAAPQSRRGGREILPASSVAPTR